MGDRFIEVYVKASVDTCAERDVKGLYAKAFSGEIKEFTGVSDPYEIPENPAWVCDTENESPEESAAKLLAYLESRELIPAARRCLGWRSHGICFRLAAVGRRVVGLGAGPAEPGAGRGRRCRRRRTGEGLVGGAVVVGGGGGDEVQLLAERQQVGGLLLAVGGVEGLDPVGAERADQVLDLGRARRCPSRGGR